MLTSSMRAALPAALTLLIGAALAAGMHQAAAQQRDATLGTGASTSPSVARLKVHQGRANSPNLVPQAQFSSAQAATAGVSLRNRASGIINLSGVKPPILGAYLY